MPDLFNMSPEMYEYLKTLPQPVQNRILHSNLKAGCLADLKQYAEGETGGIFTAAKI